MDRLAVYDQRGDRIGYDQCQGYDKNHTALDLFSHTLFHILYSLFPLIRLPLFLVLAAHTVSDSADRLNLLTCIPELLS